MPPRRDAKPATDETNPDAKQQAPARRMSRGGVVPSPLPAELPFGSTTKQAISSSTTTTTTTTKTTST